MATHRCQAYEISNREIVSVLVLIFASSAFSVPIHRNSATEQNVAFNPRAERVSESSNGAPDTWNMAEVVRNAAWMPSDRKFSRKSDDTFSGDGSDSPVISRSQRLEEISATRSGSSLEDYINPNYTMRDFMADNNIFVSSSTTRPDNTSSTTGSGLETDNVEGSGTLLTRDSPDFPLKKQKVRNENFAIKFMQQFGYMPQSDSTSSFIFTSESLKESIKTVQKFGDLPQTGELDDQTLQLMKSPRCGVPDVSPAPREGGPKGGLTTIAKQGIVLATTGEGEGPLRRPKRYVLGAGGWNKRSITYHVENYSSKLHNMDNVLRELHKAFAAWSSYARLNFTHVPDRDADIVIYFAEYDHYDGYPFDGQGGTLAHAYYPYEFGHYGGDIHFDESEQWAIEPKDEYSGLDFFTVAVHEIGHSLGLAHSYVRSSIMFPYYKGNSGHFALDHDDVMGMYELYIRRQLPGDEEYFRQQHSDATSSTSTSTTTTTAAPPRPTTTTPSQPSSTTAPEHDGTQSDAGAEDGGGEGEGTDGKARSGGGDDVEPACGAPEAGCGEPGLDYDGSETNPSDGSVTSTATNTETNNATTVLYHGDSMSVDEFQRILNGGNTQNTSLLPTEEDTWRKRREEEERRRWEEEERRKEEERKWYEEEARRAEEEARKREEDRKAYEEEIRRKEEEVWRQYQEELKKREEERKRNEEKWRKEEEERARREEEERRRAYEEELRRYEEEIKRRRQEDELRRTAATTIATTADDGWLDVDVVQASDAPDVCDGSFDAVANIRKELFMFKGEYMWRFQSRGLLRAGYPAPIRALFPGLPAWCQRIDAAYQRHNDSVIIFFVGKYFFELSGHERQTSPPRPLADLGLPEYVTQLDAAFYWPKNNKVYFFRHEEYWRFDEHLGRLDAGYPRSMERWHGVPSFLDAAYTWDAAVSYFFKGDSFWEFDNMNVVPVEGSPRPIRDSWFHHC